jgi:hypothetical protein
MSNAAAKPTIDAPTAMNNGSIATVGTRTGALSVGH